MRIIQGCDDYLSKQYDLMRKFSFCGIFATLFVTTIILLASCSQDDDCYESDMYTLAEMETRNGGNGGDPGGGGGVNLPMYYMDVISDPTHVYAYFDVIVTARCEKNIWALLHPEISMFVDTAGVTNIKDVQIKDYDEYKLDGKLYITYSVLYNVIVGDSVKKDSFMNAHHEFEFTLVDSLHPGPLFAPCNVDEIEKGTLLSNEDSLIIFTMSSQSFK